MNKYCRNDEIMWTWLRVISLLLPHVISRTRLYTLLFLYVCIYFSQYMYILKTYFITYIKLKQCKILKEMEILKEYDLLLFHGTYSEFVCEKSYLTLV